MFFTFAVRALNIQFGLGEVISLYHNQIGLFMMDFVIVVSNFVCVMAISLFWIFVLPGVAPLTLSKLKGLVDYVWDGELGGRTPHLRRFILLVSSSDTLLKVSTLDIALDIYFRQRLKIAICGSFIGLEVVNYKELWVLFYLRITFSRFSRVLWTMSKTNSICLRLRTWWVCTPRLPRFILVVNFSNTFLVVSTLDIV